MKKSRIISILSVVLIVALVIGANVWRSHTVVRDVRVDIDYQGADTLVPPERVKEIVVAAMPQIYTTCLKQVDLAAVAVDLVEEHPVVGVLVEVVGQGPDIVQPLAFFGTDAPRDDDIAATVGRYRQTVAAGGEVVFCTAREDTHDGTPLA